MDETDTVDVLVAGVAAVGPLAGIATGSREIVLGQLAAIGVGAGAAPAHPRAGRRSRFGGREAVLHEFPASSPGVEAHVDIGRAGTEIDDRTSTSRPAWRSDS